VTAVLLDVEDVVGLSKQFAAIERR